MEAWRIQCERNGWDERDEGACDKKEFDRLRDGLTWNLDETCFRAEDGVLKIIGSNERKKHEKNTSDSRLSITVVRIGSAAGIEGPRIYLGKGKEDPPSHMKKGNFSSRYTAPPGSYVKMTPNAYMTNEVWDELAADISEGIRACPGVRENPELWVVLSIDGFGSHLQGCALQVFHTYRILVIKEEGDTSQVSQAYDQMVAKSDKQLTRSVLDCYRLHIRKVINQFELIILINTALNSADPKSWRNSFIRVNMCPSKHQTFCIWVKR